MIQQEQAVRRKILFVEDNKFDQILFGQFIGTLELNNNNGTELKIQFREQQYKKAGNPDNSAK